MKTPYLQRNRPDRAFGKKALFLLGVFIFGALVFSLFDGLFVRLAAPIWKSENVVARSAWRVSGFFKDTNALLQENADLRARVASDELLISSLRSIENSREVLLNSFGRSGTSTFIGATVLVHPPETPYDFLVLDAGSNYGVKVGDSVALPEGSKIGVVIEVFSKDSRAKLFSTSGEQTNAILERGGAPVTLIGRGGGAFEIELPREVPVVAGDRVLDSTITAGMIGVVRDIESVPTDSFKKVLVESAAPIHSLHFVRIVQ
ncbi:MAG: Rod shape-determining protein MreC [Parcubacteria group bacterium]|nr:Rod shape-determining protein MreC [Parcubacteria group bacterium]